MQVAKLPTVHGGQWWVVLHDLTIAEKRVPPVQPVHAFTFLAQLAGSGSKSARFALGLALENKLFAVTQSLERLRRLTSDDPRREPPSIHLRDYLAEARVVSELDAYLGAIYASLEVVAKLNQHLDRRLPSKFHDQAKKYQLFSFTASPWLGRFFDIRSEITHFSSPLPVVTHGMLAIEFRTQRALNAFAPGIQEVPIPEILTYRRELLALLNRWARQALASVDPEAEVDTWSFTSRKAPGTHSKSCAREILALVPNE